MSNKLKKKSKKKVANNQNKNQTLMSILCASIVIMILAFGISAITGEKETTGTSNTTNTEIVLGTEAEIEAPLTNISHYADIEIVNYGTITVALDDKTAPETVANFVKLAKEGFYDGLTFHRIMEGFMMQGGDPKGNGTGGSSQTIKGEFSVNGFENNLSHVRGAISMARSKAYDSASSQFFIVHEDSEFLDGSYAVFGYVVKGINVVDAVCSYAKPTDANGTIPAANQPVIKSITIREAE